VSGSGAHSGDGNGCARQNAKFMRICEDIRR